MDALFALPFQFSHMTKNGGVFMRCPPLLVLLSASPCVTIFFSKTDFFLREEIVERLTEKFLQPDFKKEEFYNSKAIKSVKMSVRSWKQVEMVACKWKLSKKNVKSGWHWLRLSFVKSSEIIRVISGRQRNEVQQENQSICNLLGS